MSLFEELESRGFIKQMTHEYEIKKNINGDKVVFYIGYDPTADSLTVGHFVTLMFMAHMQKYGHKPIVLVGGGTVMVGDPTGKTDMRKMLSRDVIEENIRKIKGQISKFIDFSDDKAIMVDNSDWLLNLNYIEFLRDIGVNFSVNNMLRAECFKQRLEKGLSFLEFNYMIMQSYDFLVLNQKYNCIMQLGGDDQWSNMIGGMDLIRRKTGKQVYALTCNLLLTSDGKKMGKTESGAIWLDKEKTSIYDFYQYWRNIDDKDVEKTLKMLTFVPLNEIKELCSVEGEQINKAKEVLAFEVTKIIHGEEEAIKCMEASRALFSKEGNLDNAPKYDVSESELGCSLLDILVSKKIFPSKSEGRRLVTQGGVALNENKISDVNFILNIDAFKDGKAIIKKGKKNFYVLNLI